jgi:cytochrome c553/mono/diheme cytochrome c family protein
MRKFLKWTGITAGALVALLLVAYLVAYLSTNRRIHRQYQVQVKPLNIPVDSSMLAYGGRLFVIKGCVDCHGRQLEGRVFVNDPKLGVFAGANLTKGKGGLPAGFDEKEWLMALRHGLNPEGQSLIVMPSYEYCKLSDYDVASIIAWCKAQPPVNHELPPIQVGPLGHVLTFLDKLPLVPAEKIDHQYQAPVMVKREVTPAFGQYLSVSCTGCHGHNLRGGPNPLPGGTPVADITSKGHLGKWSQAQFITALRTGKTPEGRQLKNSDMPWQITSAYTEEELSALYLYLKSL